MNGVQAIVAAMESSQQWLEMYLADFTDDELLARPVPSANHAAWQLGNVIVGDVFLVQCEYPEVVFPTLPEGFASLHGSAGANIDQSPGFLTKLEYVSILNKVRTVAIETISRLTDDELDRPANETATFAGPTVGHVLMFVATHTLMHLGQFSVIRRALGKPVLF